MHNSNAILLIAPAWIGDCVMMQSLISVLQQQDPARKIAVVAPPATYPLLSRMPGITQTFLLDVRHGELGLQARLQLAKQLKNQNYDQAIILPNTWKSALLPFFAGIAKRTGWHGEQRFWLLNDRRHLNPQQLPQLVQRFVALAYPKTKNALMPNYPNPVLTTTLAEIKTTYNKFQIIDTTTPIIALCPGAEYGSAKRWPAMHFATIATKKLEQGCRVWLFGSAKDTKITQIINQATENRCLDLAGRTTLPEAIDLLSLASYVVTNDSGLMHIACALNRFVIALYGSTSPAFTPPLHSNAKILSINAPCSPCFKRECPLPAPNTLKCLRDLLPDQVLQIMADNVLDKFV